MIQSSDQGRLREACDLAGERWPGARVSLLAEERSRGAISGWFSGDSILTFSRDRKGVPVVTEATRERIRAQGFDACVLSFRDRYGVMYWHFRRIPLVAGIKGVLTIDAKDRVRWYGRTSWALATIIACTLGRTLRLPGKPFLRGHYDLMMALVVILALASCALRKAGLHAAQLRRVEGPHGKRLCIFIPTLGMGGAQRALVNFLRHIDTGKYDVEVLTRDARDKFFEPAVLACGARLTYLPCEYKAPQWRFTYALARHFARARPAVAIGWMAWATVVTAMAGALAGTPKILTSLHSESPARRQTPPWSWQRPLDVLTSPMIDRVIACSDACRDDFIRWARVSPAKVTTIYNGIDLNKVRKPSEAERHAVRAIWGLDRRPVIGTVGRLSPEKDQETFLRALALVREAVPAVCGLIVGDGGDRDRLVALAVKLGLEGCAVFLGTRQDALSIMGSLDVFVLSSETEGFPLVLLEAQALEVPVVTTAAGGAREAVLDGETGYIVPCGDRRRLADRITELLRDETKRQRQGNAGRAHVANRFGVETMAAAILTECGL